MSNLFINQSTLVELNVFDSNSNYTAITRAAQYFFHYFTGIQFEQQTYVKYDLFGHAAVFNCRSASE